MTGEVAGSPAEATGNVPGRREQWVVDAFVELAGALVEEFDLADLLTVVSERCAALLGAPEVGMLLAGDDGALHVVASSSEHLHALELFEVQRAEGPCLDVYRTGEPVLGASLSDDDRWPRFGPLARSKGFQTVHALPMRHSKQVVGVVNIFHREPTVLTEGDTAVAQALADIATFAIQQDAALRRATTLSDQLGRALRSRVVIEQAKGMLAEGLGLTMAAAFALLRRYSRSHNERLGDVAARIADRELTAADVVGGEGSGRGEQGTSSPSRHGRDEG